MRPTGLLLCLLALPAAAESLVGTVVKVADGDTLTILVGHERVRVRLAGIDAPERGQPYGKVSGKRLAEIVAGEVVRVDTEKRDRYGRIVGKVWVASPDCRGDECPKNLDASLYQIRVGMAWHYRYYAKEQSPEDRETYSVAEQDARTRRAGLWREPDPIAPWEWRRRKRGG